MSTDQWIAVIVGACCPFFLYFSIRILALRKEILNSVVGQRIPGIGKKLEELQDQMKKGPTIILAPWAFKIADRLHHIRHKEDAQSEIAGMQFLAIMLGLIALVLGGAAVALGTGAFPLFSTR